MSPRRLLPLLSAFLLAALAGCPGDRVGTPRPPVDGPGDGRIPTGDVPSAKDTPAGTYSLMFWNVENLFDDRDDGRKAGGDVTYDPWYPAHPEILKKKLERLCEVILSVNDGKGPDILCLAEVESDRAAELLQDALNAALAESGHAASKYSERLYRDPNGSRHIGCAFLSRVAVAKDRTTLLGNRQRILEGRFVAGGKELVVAAGHWSSRLSDKTGESRAKYGDVIHGRFRAMFTSNPRVDYLVCGDFNDDPGEPSVTKHLGAVGTKAEVLAARERPLMLNLTVPLAAKGQFTHYYSGGHLFDQVCVSPGLLDNEGWTVLPETTEIVKMYASGKYHAPLRFGGPSDKRALSSRGAADHFPVMVTLRAR